MATSRARRRKPGSRAITCASYSSATVSKAAKAPTDLRSRRDLEDVAFRIDAIAERDVLIAMDLAHRRAAGDQRRACGLDVVDVKARLERGVDARPARRAD